MGKYQSCDCCPYGYHIDLDFVRFCEALSLNSGNRGNQGGDVTSRQRREQRRLRREQRLQRQSMEALLGLNIIPPSPFQVKEVKPVGKEVLKADLETNASASVQVQNALQKAVSDFEETLQRSSYTNDPLLYSSNFFPENSVICVNPSVNNSLYPEVDSIAQDIESLSPGSASEMIALPDDAASVTSNASAGALQNIRDQMAVSLERMKDLEDQVKLIPVLQVQLSVLKDEKRQLQMNLETGVGDAGKYKLKNNICAKSGKDVAGVREVGVTCGVMTRDVGIAHSLPKLKTVAVQVNSLPDVDDEQLAKTHNALSSSSVTPLDDWEPLEKPLSLPASTSTDLSMRQIFSEKELDQKIAKAIKMYEETFHHLLHPKKKEKQKHWASVGVQARPPVDSGILKIIERADVGLQCSPNIWLKDAVVHVKPRVSQVGVSAVVRVRHFGSSDCRVDRVTCDNCTDNCKKHYTSVGVNTAGGSVPSDQIPFSLNSLNIARSKSFDYSEKTFGFMRKKLNSRSIGCGPAVRLKANKSTDTGDRLATPTCKDVAVNTTKRKLVDASVGESVQNGNEINICDKCSAAIKIVAKDVLSYRSSEIPGSTTNTSRIPRLMTLAVPTSPVGSDKHKRLQDSYNRTICDSLEQSTQQSSINLDFSPERRAIKPLPTEGQVVIEDRRRHPQVGVRSETAATGISVIEPRSGDDGQVEGSTEGNSSALPHSGGLLFQPIHHEKPRNKAEPSREMRAALKVLNDSLQKSPVRNLPNHLKNANNIVQQEWFKISSIGSANPLDVEDYLDCFEEISNQLLDYIVNMTDVSGNTAMHYALSHGNFDVVSILLDSKVCNINQPNAAGYTCVMLVSLVHVSSETHRQVVRRLFQLADVNIRAKQHGQTALMLAVSHGRIETVRLLLESGADVNIQDDDGSTALMCAAEHGHVDIVKLLCSQPDCDLTITDYDGSTALNIAMEAGNRDIGLLLYAQEHFSRGSSPYPLAKPRRAKSVTPTPTSHYQQPQSPLKGQKHQRHEDHTL